MLLSNSVLKQTKDKLEEVIFLLDEVTDEVCSSADLDKVILNSVYADYLPIKEWCRRFLEQQLYSTSSDTSMQWSLLLPMEYVFEDFVAGFLEKHFSREYDVEPQKGKLCLTDEGVFRMRHDVLLTHKLSGKQTIIDTKYKLRSRKAYTEKKRGIVQADLYQMLSYGYRRGCDNVLLIYPNVGASIREVVRFHISSGTNNSEKVKVYGAEIPFWSKLNARLMESTLIHTFHECLYA